MLIFTTVVFCVLAVGIGAFRRQHEGRLGKIHLLGNGLHRFVRQAARIGNDSELIAAKAGVGEHVDSLKRVAPHGF